MKLLSVRGRCGLQCFHIDLHFLSLVNRIDYLFCVFIKASIRPLISSLITSLDRSASINALQSFIYDYCIINHVKYN